MIPVFSPETFDFLWGIRLNNEKPWFEAHKQEYIDHLYEPMKALAKEVFQPLAETPGLELHVSRIYKDARMHPVVPYKESLWFSIRYRVDEWTQHPTLCFDLRPEGARFGFVLARPTPAAMEVFRQDLMARPHHFPQLLQQAREASGLSLTVEPYKRPKPCPVPELEPYFYWKSWITAMETLEPGDQLFSPDLAPYVQEKLLAWKPVFDYFVPITQNPG